MQDREKKLAIVLAVVVATAFGKPIFDRSFVQPVRTLSQQRDAAAAELSTKEVEEVRLQAARRRLTDWRAQSLPPDPLTAQRVYKDWLLDLADLSGFMSPTPSLPTVSLVRSRTGTFTEVPVEIDAKATFEQLARFLVHFHRADLLHRIDNLDIDSPRAEGTPVLDIRLKATGLALRDVPDRLRLFPRTTLAEDISADETTIEVADPAHFPTAGECLVMIDRELLTVKEIDGDTWTVARGEGETVPAEHKLDADVDLFRLRPVAPGEPHTLADFRLLLENNPFTKPAPPLEYNPSITPHDEQVVTRGEPWKESLAVNSWDPAGGSAVFRLEGNVPAGMEIDPKTGEWTWDVAADEPVGTHQVTVWAESPVLASQRVSAKIPIRLREPNLPPEIAPIDTQTAYSGQPLTIELGASDPDGDSDSLTYALTGDVLQGAAIDANGGVKWTPAIELELKEYQLTVSVTDQGDPPQTVSVDVPVKLEEDAALRTYLTTYFQDGDSLTAQLYNRFTNEHQDLTIGSVLKAADIEATVTQIEPQYILLEIDSQTFRLDMGRNLRSLKPVETASQAAENQPAAPASG